MLMCRNVSKNGKKKKNLHKIKEVIPGNWVKGKEIIKKKFEWQANE